MSLPKIDVPIYDLKLPSNGQELKVRPFLVREEKLLLMAVKSDDAQEIIKTTKQVINNCILEPQLNVDNLPFFDVDYLFIALRAKSIGESVEVNFICQNEVDGNKCKGRFPVNIDIANVEVEKRDDITQDIKFNDDLIFKMKYPTYAVLKQLNEGTDKLENAIRIITASIDRIFIKGQYYTSKDMTPNEMYDFLEQLTQEQFNKLQEYINNFPSFHVVGEGTCKKCGKTHNVRYKDFVRFFQ